MVVLGAATHSLPFSPELIEQGIGLLFASKEPRILQGNLSAFHRGRSAGQFYALMRNLGIASASISRILSRLDFDQFPIPDEIITAWQDFFSNSQAEKLAASVFEANVVLPMKVEIPYRLLEGLAPQILASAAT
jgi:hypothetical protein